MDEREIVVARWRAIVNGEKAAYNYEHFEAGVGLQIETENAALAARVAQLEAALRDIADGTVDCDASLGAGLSDYLDCVVLRAHAALSAEAGAEAREQEKS